MNGIRDVKLLGIALALLVGGRAYAAQGATSAAFLKIGMGARPAAMGEAFTGLADDIDALYWNPAGLTHIEHVEESFSHTSWLEGINGEYAAFAGRLSPRSVLAGGIEYVSVGDIERVDKEGRISGSYQSYDLAGMVSYARTLRPNLSAGATLKVLQEKIENESGRAFALDLGALYELRRLSLGAAARNLGTGLTFRETASPLPLALRFGAAYRLSDTLALSSDINLPSDNAASFHFGGEYVYAGFRDLRLALRGGLKTSTLGYLDGLSALSLGLGVYAGSWGVDYALAPYGEFGMSHRLSLKVSFSAAARAPREEPAAPKKVEIVVEKEGVRVARDPQTMYREAMQWFEEKRAKEKLDAREQAQLLEKIQEKFAPLGVDVSAAKEMRDTLTNGQQ